MNTKDQFIFLLLLLKNYTMVKTTHLILLNMKENPDKIEGQKSNLKSTWPTTEDYLNISGKIGNDEKYHRCDNSSKILKIFLDEMSHQTLFLDQLSY